MNLKSEGITNILKIFLWVTLVLISFTFLTTLIYTVNYDFYLQIELIDSFLELIFVIIYIMLGVIYLIWLFIFHKDLNRIYPGYPISPWGAIARVLIPFYSIYGLWNVYSTMQRHFEKFEETNSFSSRLMNYIPMYYFLIWVTYILDRFVNGSAAEKFLGESYGIVLTISYFLNLVLIIIYLLLITLVTKAINILATHVKETKEEDLRILPRPASNKKLLIWSAIGCFGLILLTITVIISIFIIFYLYDSESKEQINNPNSFDDRQDTDFKEEALSDREAALSEREDEIILKEGFYERQEASHKEELIINAQEVSFNDVNAEKFKEETYFKLTGVVGPVGSDFTGVLQQFTLTTVKDTGYGVYLIKSEKPVKDNEMLVVEGDIITVYGIYLGKDADTSMPLVFIRVLKR